MISDSVISYPIPAYQNVPIQDYYFLPSQFFIEDITLGVQTLVTATVNMNYVVGQQVRLLVPPSFGCYQLNGVSGYVISIPETNQVLLDIDSSQNVDAFISADDANQPQILAIGDINNGIISSTGQNIPSTNVPGSFINISPERNS